MTAGEVGGVEREGCGVDGWEVDCWNWSEGRCAGEGEEGPEVKGAVGCGVGYVDC